jgi:hypothetical protein
VAFNAVTRRLLTLRHRRALDAASNIVLDHLSDDLEEAGTSRPPESLHCLPYLPARHRDRYDATFLRKLLVCAVVVGLKQRFVEGDHPLACVGEHLAFRYVTEVAVEWGANVDDWDDREVEAFRRYVVTVMEDLDLSLLYEGAGAAGAGEARAPLDAFLGVDRWFEPFFPEHPVHPYCDEEPETRDSPPQRR